MAVSDGQNVNAAVTNSAFVDKNTASTFTNAILDLQNADLVSGAFVYNVQRELNKVLLNVQATQTIVDSTPIVLNEQKGNQLILVVGDGGPVVLSNPPFSASNGFFDGQIVKIVGTDDTNSVTMLFSDSTDGAVLNGNATLQRFQVLTLVYSSELERWLELDRNF